MPISSRECMLIRNGEKPVTEEYLDRVAEVLLESEQVVKKGGYILKVI